MDYGLITAIASGLGVVGGLVSLVFLILEVRHNAHAIEGATVQSLMSLEFEVFGLIGTHAELYLKGCEGLDGLDAPERLRFDRIVGAQMSMYYSAFVQFQQGLIVPEVWEAYDNALKVTLEKPGFAACWQAMQTRYPRSFRARFTGGA